MDALKERFISAKTEKEREAVRQEIRKACTEDPQDVAEIALEQILQSHAEIDSFLIRRQLEEILPFISLAYVAETYFGKSRQWLYQRINGTLVNGKRARFTPAELSTLNSALQDMGRRLQDTRIS